MAQRKMQIFLATIGYKTKLTFFYRKFYLGAADACFIITHSSLSVIPRDIFEVFYRTISANRQWQQILYFNS